jgi:Fe-S-cluster-containing hydrogenase component 2
MAKKVPAVDYAQCRPENCDNGVCSASLECEHGSLVQEEPYETPEVNPAKWCHSCAKCARACPLGAIRLIEQ